MTTPFRLAAAVAIGLVPIATAGSTPASPNAIVAPAPTAELDVRDVSAFIDGFIPYALARGDISGAAVVVVKDGKVLVAKGFGYADRASRRPIDVENTLFRQASISKLFAWTAVMQLSEAGKLDLDRDINTYLDFEVPPRFGRPITLRHLLTHRSGFAETYRELMTPDRASTPTLETYVKRHLPDRIYPPGTNVAYSNYGATLAGYIVQRVSGERFEDYVARHIFAPLGMRHSTFEQPPRRAVGEMATGYIGASGQPYAFEYAGDVPAGGLSASAGDMARFMIAHLDEGGPLLSPTTTSRMHAPAFRQIPQLPGMALGFYEEDRNGRRVIGHAGDLVSFHTDLHLLPAERVGVYIAMNSWGREDASSSLRRAFFHQFMDRYYPRAAGPTAPPPKGSAERAQAMSGTYASTRRSASNLGTLVDLFGQGRIETGEGGTISFSQFRDAAGVPKRWREVRPNIWREVGGTAILAAEVKGGQVYRLYADDQPAVLTFVRTTPWQSAAWRLPALSALVLLMSLAALAWPAGALLRWKYGIPAASHLRPRAERWALRTMALGNSLFAGGWLGILTSAGTQPSLLGPGLDPWIRLLQAIGIVSFVATIVFASRVGRRWRARATTVGGGVIDLILIVAGLATAFFAFDYHLFNFGLRY
ncbi:hypothetical protein ASE06_19775 [Sphingopyxis sp. Root214]|uniref:serine hydrolase domain-containing protein n=1 Tax=unclassified Sphingopyxis TaxID=2614943 RepID=UPI0006F4F521|nr:MULTISPECIES: serine hydrolase domain-containing protein [unclassified Sphingopyxis]KQZ71641.1 hypothetical protein ASD73_17440 [Sphingopyxis sp. Root154]KRC05550.1 hypothetical protein ASE06_19775 [Sphingopyxis sp. Root214]